MFKLMVNLSYPFRRDIMDEPDMMKMIKEFIANKEKSKWKWIDTLLILLEILWQS